MNPPRPAAASNAELCRIPFNFDSLHDLSSPIDQIGTLVDLILHKHGDTLDGEVADLLGFVEGSAHHLQNLLVGLRLYVRVLGSPGTCCASDANALFCGALASIQPAIDHHGAIVTHDPLPAIECDPNQISFALACLLDNALKFRSERRPEVHVSASGAAGAWVFSVRDNGIGIDPQLGERIFGLFKRIHGAAYPGAGVGLAITRQIVVEHGGRIWFESQPGAGATFFFTLPVGGHRLPDGRGSVNNGKPTP